MDSSDSLEGYDIVLGPPGGTSTPTPASGSGTELDPPVGPTVDDLATALVEQPEQHASSLSDVTVGGYAGKKVELSHPAVWAIATSRCVRVDRTRSTTDGSMTMTAA